ncbi:Copine-domain-containing protein [Gamsiella multidivaricata]|uniref:Copine-domain-containing protein n=1 Tax=Gamsiella multidivaricata TaxID=101098 RepID=UPI00221EC8EE|nr:Copine-domain-containing protein [Gamsiella multidivaricata]KAI7829646.1 Copine-domain-containing protein [Gamsiella multidivaricata]
MMDPKTRTWCKEPIGKTEMILNKLDCEFVKSIVIDYRFEQIQPIRFTVVDVDNRNNPLWTAQELIGHFDTEVGKIIGSRGRSLAGRLDHPQHRNSHRGTVIVSAEEQSQSKRVIRQVIRPRIKSRLVKLRFLDQCPTNAHILFFTCRFNIEATKIAKKALFRSDPSSFFIVHRASENGVFSPIYQSHVVRSKSNPIWDEFSIKEIELCNGDPNRQLKIEVKRFKENGQHVTIGITPYFTLQDLLHLQKPKYYPLSPMPPGTDLVIRRMMVTEPPSFLDYLAGGIPLNLVVAIDFTQSNGDPRDPRSLHFRNPSGENDYTRAIRSVGNILQCYDTDKKFPVYGFGGKVNGQVSHCFALNGNPQFPEVDGVDGILAAYWHALQFAELYGPTNFSPVINQTAAICNQHRSGQMEEYYVLLILTDGVITDMDNTIRAIIDASRLPLSIIIVGVGSANFDNMNVLDADDEPLRANGVTMARDIVQFVPFRDFQAGTFGNEELAEAVLAEVPDQFVSYMTQHSVKPRAPPRADTMMARSNGGITSPNMRPMSAMPAYVDTAASPNMRPMSAMPAYGSYGAYSSVPSSPTAAGPSVGFPAGFSANPSGSRAPQIVPDRYSYQGKA